MVRAKVVLIIACGQIDPIACACASIALRMQFNFLFFLRFCRVNEILRHILFGVVCACIDGLVPCLLSIVLILPPFLSLSLLLSNLFAHNFFIRQFK